MSLLYPYQLQQLEADLQRDMRASLSRILGRAGQDQNEDQHAALLDFANSNYLLEICICGMRDFDEFREELLEKLRKTAARGGVWKASPKPSASKKQKEKRHA